MPTGLKLSEAEEAELKAMIERWSLDPIAFVLEVFGPGYEEETGKELVIDRWQQKLLKSLVPHEPHGNCDGRAHTHVAAKACKGPGKTACKAWVCWWRMLTRRHHQGYCISITKANLESNLWKELAHWRRFSPLLSAFFEHKAEVIEAVDHRETWWLQARAFAQDADKDKQAESLAGLHADAVSIFLDEVGSYPMGVFDAAKGIFNTVGVDALLFASGNATTVDGPLYHIFTAEAEQWFLVEITGDPDDPDRSPRIDIEVAREEIRLHGREDPVVMVNILGKFPPRGSNKLLGADDVSKAMRRDDTLKRFMRAAIVWGLDCAGEGLDPDASKLYKRQGNVCFKPRSWRNVKTDVVAQEVAWEYHEAKRKGRAPQKIFVDKGGVGRGTYDTLRTLLGSTIVMGVDFGERALDEIRYDDRRTEMYCLAAHWVRDEGCLPEIPELRRDLTAMNIGVTTTGGVTRRLLESKKLLKKRGCPSPDDGDAFALTFAFPVLPLQTDEELLLDQLARSQPKKDPFAVLGGRGR